MKYKLRDLGITTLEWFLASFVFILSTLSVYSFAYICREAFRVVLIGSNYDIIVLTDREVYFSNVFFAALAIIIGASNSIKFLIYKHIRLKNKSRVRSGILNDQQFLNYALVGSMVEFTICLSIFYNIYLSVFMSNIKSYWYLFVLIIFVLFLSIWRNIYRFFKFNKPLFFICSTLIFIFYSFTLAKLELIDYKTINSIVLNQNIFHGKEYDLAESHVYNFNNLSMNRICFLTKPDSNYNRIFIDNEAFDSFEDLDTFDLDRSSFHHDRIGLFIDKELSMKDVCSLREILIKKGILTHYATVTPKDIKIDKFEQRICNLRLGRRLPTELNKKEYLEGRDEIEMKILDGQIYLESKPMDSEKLMLELKSKFDLAEQFYLSLNYDESTLFRDYIDVLSSFIKLVIDKRNAYAIDKHGKKFDFLSKGLKHEIRTKFPIIIEDPYYQLFIDNNLKKI